VLNLNGPAGTWLPALALDTTEGQSTDSLADSGAAENPQVRQP
jgi:hypothetical protein